MAARQLLPNNTRCCGSRTHRRITSDQKRPLRARHTLQAGPHRPSVIGCSSPERHSRNASVIDLTATRPLRPHEESTSSTTSASHSRSHVDENSSTRENPSTGRPRSTSIDLPEIASTTTTATARHSPPERGANQVDSRHAPFGSTRTTTRQSSASRTPLRLAVRHREHRFDRFTGHRRTPSVHVLSLGSCAAVSGRRRRLPSTLVGGVVQQSSRLSSLVSLTAGMTGLIR